MVMKYRIPGLHGHIRKMRQKDEVIVLRYRWYIIWNGR